jgi:hypothetical protein
MIPAELLEISFGDRVKDIMSGKITTVAGNLTNPFNDDEVEKY